MKTITAVQFDTIGIFAPTRVTATFENGTTGVLFSFYPDELTFAEADFVGRTANEARELRHKRDVAYLRS